MILHLAKKQTYEVENCEYETITIERSQPKK